FNAMIRIEFPSRDQSLLEQQLSRCSTLSPPETPIRESASQLARALRRAIFQSAPLRQRPRSSAVAIIRPQVPATTARRGTDFRRSRRAGSWLSTATPSLRRAAASPPRFVLP